MSLDLASRLEPETAAALERMPTIDISDLERERRALLNRPLRRPDRERVTSEDRMLPGKDGGPEVLTRFYRPLGVAESTTLPCLVWIHGGGFVMGGIDRDDGFLETVVATLGCAAVSIEWRQAPEHPFPAAHNDCYSAVRWVFDHAAEAGVDADRIVLGGGSCGAGLAAGVALRLRDEGEHQPCLQLLIYPMLDDRSETESCRAITDPRLWNHASNVLAWRHYLGGLYGTDAVPAYAAPTRADDLSGLPPTFLAVGDVDALLDEGVEYAERLSEAGVPTELHVYPGMIHGFNGGAIDSPQNRRYRADRDAALRAAFGTRPG